MIPKKIHYCWFGGNPKPDLVMKCLDSWKVFAPDFEIIEWNENNFSVDKYDYSREALEHKRFAFVSDVARFDVLYEHGGIYLDTDVELLKPIDQFLDHQMFMGYDQRGLVASGLIFGSVKEHMILSTILEYYTNNHFILNNGRENTTTVVTIVSDILEKMGVTLNGNKMEKDEFIIYPASFFDPYDYEHNSMTITDSTYAIHHYSGSWKSNSERLIYKAGLVIKKMIGRKNYDKVARIKHKIWG